MIKTVINGTNLYLRKVTLADVTENYLFWMNDPTITQYLECRFQRWTIKSIKDYVKKTNKDESSILLAICKKTDGKHIGNIKVGLINKIHKYAEVGIIIGYRSDQGKGYGTEAIKLVVDFVFNNLELHKLIAGVYINNLASIKLFKKIGFSAEGIKKKQYLYNNKFIDAIMFGLINEKNCHIN